MNTKESKTSSFVMINIIIGFSFLVCFSRFVQKISSLKHSVYRPPETYHRLERCKYTVSFDRISSVKKAINQLDDADLFFSFFLKKISNYQIMIYLFRSGHIVNFHIAIEQTNSCCW